MKRLLGLLLLFCYGSISYSQSSFQFEKAKEYIQENKKKWNLTTEDISALKLIDSHASTHNGMIHMYFQQTINGIPIYNAITNINVSKEGKVYNVGHRFLRDPEKRTIVSSQDIGEVKAIQFAAVNIGIVHNKGIQPLNNLRTDEKIFSAPFSDSDIKVKQVYVEDDERKLRLCYDLAIDPNESPDYWSLKIDKSTGEVIHKVNYTLYCSHPAHASMAHRDCSSQANNSFSSINSSTSSFMQSASYLVYLLPLGGPNEGNQAVATDQEFLDVSPFGWHDINGVAPDFTITKGNNVHAYEDIQKKGQSQGNEPDGGSGLSFMFTHDRNAEPFDNKDAAITNLFYTCNMAHDLFYMLGFTEPAGNYQISNFGNGGRENDQVNAEGLDGGDIDNARFTLSPDGSPGRMQMYLFNTVPGLLKIESPVVLSDLEFEVGTATFGASLSSVDLEGQIVVSKTANSEEEFTGCEEIVNDVAGKIVLIDRGTCNFIDKVFNVQEKGSIMAIVCNIAGVEGGSGEELLSMSADEEDPLISETIIPSAFMKKSDCDLIKATIENGETVVMSVKERESQGPSKLNGSFDNTVILHEYGHGVSTRLVGGPSNSNCLENFDDDGDGFDDRGEQMGEGWSDFFGLAFTTKVTDNRNNARGVGTYLLGGEPESSGFRTFPYSTDMDINPLTYDDIKTSSVPHGVGTVWAAMLWDLYWNFIDLYGFNPDWSENSSGNFKAALLVMDGLKLTPCRPGFTDTRDAILEADKVNFDGIHEKLIWETFARRGLGVNADQASTTNQRDGTEDFNIPPLLIEEIKITKEVSKFVTAGEDLEVNIHIVNHIPSIQSNVTLQDELPAGLTYVPGSAAIEPDIQGDMLIWNLGSMDYLQEINFSYSLESDLINVSTTLFIDDIENGNNGWKPRW